MFVRIEKLETKIRTNNNPLKFCQKHIGHDMLVMLISNFVIYIL